MTSTPQDMEVEAASNGSGPPSAARTLTVACLSPQPWHVDLPTNRQQVMARVAESGHHVLFVDTGTHIGRHLRRLLGARNRRSRLRQLLGTETISEGLHVTTAPALVPWGHRFRFAARVNALLTARRVRRYLRRRDDATVLWLYDPCFAWCIGRSGERLAVYDCVDDYAEQAGPDTRKRELLEECDRLAASRSRLVFATSRSLVERHRAHNQRTHLVGNVGDFAHFAPAAQRSFAAADVATCERPTIGFAGNFLSGKVSFDLLEEVASRRPDWTLLLVGPEREDTRTALDRLAARANVRWLGAVSYDELPRYVAAFDVALIPYLGNAYTRSCFPLKTYEYLAAGKPVVASGLPELAGMEPHVVLDRRRRRLSSPRSRARSNGPARPRSPGGRRSPARTPGRAALGGSSSSSTRSCRRCGSSSRRTSGSPTAWVASRVSQPTQPTGGRRAATTPSR